MLGALLPPAASANAGAIDLVLTLVHVLMVVMFAGWAAYLAWVLVRYRRARQPRASYHGAAGRLAKWTEAGVVAAEAVLLVVFALPLWFQQTAPPPVDAHAVAIRIVAQQFVWNVHYPGADGEFGVTSPGLVSAANAIGLDRTSPHGADDIVTQNFIHVPVGRQVVIQLTSEDVIHSFGAPNFRVKRDVIPGLVSTVWFTPTRIGQFDVACSQLCGLGHYRMRGVIVVESEADFAKYLSDQAALIGK